MNTFNFNNYKALIKYSWMENKRSYLVSLLIGVLAFISIVLLCFWGISNNMGTENFDGADKTGVAIAASVFATMVFSFAMQLVVTQFELVNRVCIAREGSHYCLLPASYREKGWAILTLYFMVWILGTILFYLFSYTFMSVYYLLMGATIDYNPIQPFLNIFDALSVQHMNKPGSPSVVFTLRLILYMIPVTLIINVLYYLVLVTFFKSKAQLKAQAVNFVIQNLLSYLIIGVFSLVGLFWGDAIEIFLTDVVNVKMVCYFVNVLILLQIPVVIGFGYWFFRRLHYKEIR